MPKKPKFKPVITRVKLNPEQAVLVCDCYNTTFRFGAGTIGFTSDSPLRETYCINRNVFSQVSICDQLDGRGRSVHNDNESGAVSS